MKYLNLRETEIGGIQPNTFRPTEAESLVLMNISNLIDQGRTVTQQDAINVPQEELEEKQIDPDNVESAFAQLEKLKMIEVQPDQTITISSAGQPVIEELKKAKEQAELTNSDSKDTGELPQNPMGDESSIQGQSPMPPGGGMPPMESFGMIKYLDDMSKLLEQAKKFVK